MYLPTGARYRTTLSETRPSKLVMRRLGKQTIQHILLGCLVACLHPAGLAHAESTALPTSCVEVASYKFVISDAKAAIELCSKAIAKAPSSALLKFGLARAHYSAGQYDLARKWGQESLDQGISRARNMLGLMHFFGQGGSSRDEHLGFNMLKSAADEGDFYAMSNLGWCFEFGRGVEKDRGMALSLYLKAAALGHPYANTFAGRMLGSSKAAVVSGVMAEAAN